MNITKCNTREGKCLGGNDCCFECDYKGWCEAKCPNHSCRHEKIALRLGAKRRTS